jgi:oligopeptide/dipeptide ABC transporter ATP-binding protein
MSEPLLTVDSLGVSIKTRSATTPILRDVGLELAPGEALGLVGESGSGKSMTARAIMRLLPAGANVTGRIAFGGRDVMALSRADLRQHRIKNVGLIYQDARAYTNPVRTVGDFLTESLRINLGVPTAEANRRAISLMEDMRIGDPERRMRQYPHQLSGGLLQRVMIAAVLATEPSVIIADEPTTALDVTTQAEVMAIFDEQRRERGLSLLFITHDLDLAAAVCDRMCVMYAGTIVEMQPAEHSQDRPIHPYTRALLDARPSIEDAGHRLAMIPGRPMSASEAPGGCSFAPRCRFVEDACRETEPPPIPAGAGISRCLRVGELQDTLAIQRVE